MIRCSTIPSQASKRNSSLRATPRRPPRSSVGNGWPATAAERSLPRAKATASIEPLEVKSLGKIELQTAGQDCLRAPLPRIAAGGFRHKAAGRTPAHFRPGCDRTLGRTAEKPRRPMPDDDASKLAMAVELPTGPDNLAFVGNGAKPATASSARPEPIHQPPGLNDGVYGNGNSWIGTTPRSWFQIDLGKPATIGRFKLGRDRTGRYQRSGPGLSEESKPRSTARHGKPLFEKTGLKGLPGFNPARTMTIQVAPSAGAVPQGDGRSTESRRRRAGLHRRIRGLCPREIAARHLAAG